MKARRRTSAGLRTILVLISLCGATALLVAQLTGGDAPPSRYLPKGALLYVETPNLQALLDWWRNSDINAGWQKSRNHEYFQNSRLYMKLQDRTSGFGAAAGFGFSMDNLAAVSGTQSGLALYDIGELKAVAMTRTSFEQAQTSELWAARQNFVTRKAGSLSYFVEPQDGVLAFAYAKPYLVVSTEESLLQQTLQAMQSGETDQGLEQWDKWQQLEPARSRQAPEGQTTILRLFLDQENMNRNRYFRRYWIQDNVRDLEPIQAAWIEMTLGPEGITERRTFHRADQPAAATDPDRALHTIVRRVSGVRHDLLFFTATPSADSVASSVVDFVNPMPDQQKKASYPPSYSGSYARAKEAAAKDVFREQIDEPILGPANLEILRADQPEALSEILSAAGITSEMLLAYPLWDDKAMFVRFVRTVAFSLRDPDKLDSTAFLESLRRHALILASVDQGNTAPWHRMADGAFAFDWIDPVYVLFQKPWVLVSNSEPDLQKLAFALQSENVPIPTAGFYRELNWANSRWKYSRLMQRLDVDSYRGEEPLLFSENLDSLFWALSPIASSSVTGSGPSEVVTYAFGK